VCRRGIGGNESGDESESGNVDVSGGGGGGEASQAWYSLF